jgi:transposase InsO family protein
MDLITDLPVTKHGYDAVVTFVDRLTQQVHFAPTTKTVTAAGLARVFRQTVYRHHGLPRVIISDRDDRFCSHFWKALFALVGTELRFSTAFHPQTDGQSERANRTLEQFLRHYISSRQDDWDFTGMTTWTLLSLLSMTVSTRLLVIPPFISCMV